jgi:GrpB-like predicted nucleotidyltransferase (UPF0157 family)
VMVAWHVPNRLGLDHGEVALSPSDPYWANAFEEFARMLRTALGDALGAVEHVGSTAVPGLVAKPIVDIAIQLRAGADVRAVTAILTQVGLEYRGDNGDEGGRLFVLNSRPNHRVAHVHVVERGDRCWPLYLLFRDRLRADPSARRRYADVKQDLAGRFPHDRPKYTAGKAHFIRRLLAEEPHCSNDG